MTLRRPHRSLRRCESLRRHDRDRARRETLRHLNVESLEERRLLATAPVLVGVQPDGEEMLLDGDTRHVAPSSLLFYFDSGQEIDPNSLSGISLIRSGLDHEFGNGNDIVIRPGYVGLGDTPSQVVMRFAQTLPDDLYRIVIAGTGSTPLRNTDGLRFQNGLDRTIEFRLDLGAQVVAVVPQPITLNTDGTLSQRRDQIIVYFNNDDLYVPDAQNPALYKLVFTAETVRNTDDVIFLPTSVVYDAAADRATLTFADEFHKLINPDTGLPVGAGTFRLRIGTDEEVPPLPLTLSPAVDIGSSFATAFPLGTLTSQSQIVSAAIDPEAFLLDFPGGNDDIGHREIPEETAGGFDNHINPQFGADRTQGITTILYNFRADYGVDDKGLPLKNLITETQKQRAREAFEVWAHYLGVQFLETTDKGLTVVTGDPRALDPYAEDVVNHALVKPEVNAHFIARVDPDFQESLLILDNAFQWNNLFNGDWYKTAMIGIGFMLGLERATDLPPSTLMAFASDEALTGPAVEPIYPGNHDILHGLYLHRPDSNDIDLYRFEIAAGQEGVMTAETFAERQPSSSLLDTLLTLYRENADGSRVIIARNDDYFGDDSFIQLRLGAGTYYLGVSASGNDSYNPEFENTGFGGKSQGPYDLRIDFRPDPAPGSALRDATRSGAPGTLLDGDADGVPGGVYNFFFRAVGASNTIIVDKLNRALVGGSKGTYRTISSALAASSPGDIVRIVGNGGADGNLLTLQDNLAYEIGPGPLPNQILSDGKTLDVPRGVTLMVDAGVQFKMNQSRIGVGSSLLSVDRSGGAFQVLGIPGLPVYFTSYFDESIGLDTYLPTTSPRPGDWGGIVFRNDVDNAEERFNYEREGIFLNYVNHADMRYGGGNVIINSIKQIVTPIHMTEARPTISFNTIRLSADAPLSADPDSFEETSFHAPRFQLKGLFTTYFHRVGPDIHGNLLVENSSNGLFVRITTPAGEAQRKLTVPARFDDTDVVHLLADNLAIAGKSGEPILELARPPVNVVTATRRTGGQMEAGTYHYKIVFVDANGFEGRPSEATVPVTLSGSYRSVRLDKLPAAGGDFVARRIYRSVDGVAGPYVFVNQINTSDTVYTDTRSLAELDPNNLLNRDVPTVLGATLTASTADGTLPAGLYNYRITYAHSVTNVVSPSSDPTISRVLPATGQIQLDHLTPPDPGRYDLIRIYRSADDGAAPYYLVGEIAGTETTFLDTGQTLDEMLQPVTFGVARARTAARLAIDPGIIVKLEGARIESTFGAQLIAEGTPGREIIFTSRSDDRFGAGGTFDTNADGQAQSPRPGDWGGLYIGPIGSASIDHALLTFGGGITKIEGTFKAFNILEVHQADIRLANSVIEYNANGQGGQGPVDRFGRSYNEPATIYVRGAQPILVNNTIQHNAEVAISINANSFTSATLPDTGRSTGLLQRVGNFSFNVGPLIRGNVMLDNPLNAVDIRGETLTTMSVWDDTDIVHVLRGEKVIVPDFHSQVGLLLASSPSASLVIKMDGPGDSFNPNLGAGFTAKGSPLGISDHIGGTMQIIGQPDFPVILTSLKDDTVGAGLLPNGQTLTDTNNDGQATLPAAGDWASVRFEQLANDRNVELILETESPATAAPGENATPDTAQHLGRLASSEYAGDDKLRLGFVVRGALNARNDLDVYSFEAEAGTEVWLDIDRTTNTLNSVVELLDADGVVLARSDDSLLETLDPNLLYRAATMPAWAVNPLQKKADAYQPHNASGLAKDFYSLNPLDAGMRVVLPGVVGVRSTYHVRVRSSSDDLSNLAGGLTTGSYELQIRLRETDEIPGVTVRYAEVRYATNGIELYGLPAHSPLLGEVAEDEEVGGPETNNQIPPTSVPGMGPQDIGNLLATDRGMISIAGRINELDDIDFYEMQVQYPATAGSLFEHASVVFDVDYASGMSRADTIVSVFDSFGRLVLIGRNSNITDDRSGPLDEGSLTDLSRGSVGGLDPFIGPVELPQGTYFVSVTSNARIPSQLDNPDVRLEPINTITRVAEDHILASGGSTAAPPQVDFLLGPHSIPFTSTPDIVALILHSTGEDDEVQLSAAGLDDGVVTRTVGPYPGKVQDLATRLTGNSYTFTTPDADPAPNDSSVGILRGVNTSAPQFIASRDDGIETYQESPTTPGVAVRADVGIRFHAMTYGVLNGDGIERLFAVGSRGDADLQPAGPDYYTNILYQFDPDTGQALSAPQSNRVGNARMRGAGTQIVERGHLDTNVDQGPGGLISGLAILDGKLYALSDTGGVFLVVDPLTNHATLDYLGNVVADAGDVLEKENNDSPAEAHDLDQEVWTKTASPDIGDMTSNTSTTISHITIRGTGDDGYIGNFITHFGGPGADQPTGWAFDQYGDLYIAAAATNRVLKYDGVTGTLIGEFIAPGADGLDRPEGLAFYDRDGDGVEELYVASRGSNTILCYNGQTGAYLATLTNAGLNQPTGLAFGPDTTGDGIPELYVSSFGSDNVYRFDVVAETSERLFPSGRGGLDGPVGLTYHDNRLYIASSLDDSVLVFNAETGRFVGELVPSGSGGLEEPQYLAFGPDANGDGDGELYVSSYATNSVLRYNARTGAFVDDFVYAGNGNLTGPTSVGFLANGHLIVASSGTDSVIEFDTAGKPTFDFYKFTVANDGDRGIFDIDYGMTEEGVGFDSVIAILDSTGALVAMNDDASMRFGQGGSESSRDAYLEIVFDTAGVYYLMVGESPVDRADLTDTYVLHVSLENYVGRSLEGLAANMWRDPSSSGVLVAVDRQGDLYAFTTDGASLAPALFFEGGTASQISTGVQDVMGLSLVTTNLWHISTARRDDKGHGLTNVFDDSRGSASVVKEREPNDTVATAHDLELEFWSLGYDSNIGDTQDPPLNTSTTIPHITVRGGGDKENDWDFYSFKVTAPLAHCIFDIDMDYDEQLDPHGFMDSEIVLLDQYGNILAWLEDSVLPTDGDGGKSLLYDPPLEPCLELDLPAGTYIVAVTQFVNGFIFQPLQPGDFYTLHISVEGHRVDAPLADAGYSFFFGPELTGIVTNAVAGEPVQITSPGHGLEGGERVDVQGVLGIPGANGTFTVSVVDDDTFELDDSDATGTYLGGGVWRLLQIPEDVRGSIVTNPFSLLGYSAEDQPVLYFNYLLDSDASTSIDVVSVSIIVGDGVPQPVAIKGAGLRNMTPDPVTLQPVWQQARIELGDYANLDNLRLVFTFDSADSTASGLEGLLIDDIIIGFAERGEMVSYAYNDPSFTINPDSQTTDALTGEYQLEIRLATDPGFTQRPTAGSPNSLQLARTFDTNERLARQTTLAPTDGSQILDGDTFTISDGINTLVFEFDTDGVVESGHVRVPFEAGFSTQQVCVSVRDAINSAAVQAVLKVRASVSAATIRGTTFADGTLPTGPVDQLVDLAGTAIVTGIRHITYDGFGDSNRFRDQGQVLIHSNFVIDSRDFGIVADGGTRDVEPRLAAGFLEPHPGAARNLRELNNSPAGGLAPGATIENNVIHNEGLGGIHVSGSLAPFEIVPPSDTLQRLSGYFVQDGLTFTVHMYRTSVTFEFEDISGGQRPLGSGVQGGDGWTEGNIPIFYRQSGSNYLAPPWVIPPRPYTQAEMAVAIRDAIQSSILVTNGTTLHANATLENSRWRSSLVVPDGALYGPPLLAVYLDNVSSVEVPRYSVVEARQVPLGRAVQPFQRVINNTVFGNDGLQAFFAQSGLHEPNDRMQSAIETWQGRQQNPEYYSSDASIGDTTETLNDASLDVDFYRFQLGVGERVTIDIDRLTPTFDSVIRLFDARGREVAFNDNANAPGELPSKDSYLDFTATVAGTYYVGVSGKGNEGYDPLSLGNRTGPASVGDYHIEINVIAPRTWVITAVDGTRVADGTTFVVSDLHGSVTYEFDDVNAPGVAEGHIPIVYDSRPVHPQGFNHRGPGYRAPEMAVAMANTIGQGLTGVTAVALGGHSGASGNLPPQTPAIAGDTSVYGFPGFGHDSPYTPPRATSELYVVVRGATRITGDLLFRPMLDENIDQLLPETGILVSDGSSPTLLNNLLANLNAGIWQDASPTTVVGGSIYQHNDLADSNVGSTGDDFNVRMGDYDPLFVNSADRNFYPAPMSPVIDCAIDSLEERVGFALVKNAMGIPVSPILAPDLDAAGLLRSDDPEVDTPAGQGANVFKDRGALDRADFVGPDAVLIVPRDNDAAGIDRDPTPTVVQLAAGDYNSFVIQLVDGLASSESGEGTGVDDLTVDSSRITLTADGQVLEEGVDYIFRYNATTNTMRFMPLAGKWDNDVTYKITLPNEDRFVIVMPDGSQISDGEMFVITDNTGGTVTFEFECGYSLYLPETLTLHVPAAGKGPGGLQDGQTFVVSAGAFGNHTFEFDVNSPPMYLVGNNPIDIAAASTQDELAAAIINALNAKGIGITARYLGDGVIHFGARSNYTINTANCALTQSGRPGIVADGQNIMIADGIHPNTYFEFDSDGSVMAGRVPIRYSAASTRDDIAASIVNAISGSVVGLTPTYFGNGHVYVGGTPSHRLVVSGAPNLWQSGTPGVRSSTVLIIPPQAAGVGGLADGQTFSIQNRPGAPVVFEFDSNGSVTPGNRPILIRSTSTVDQLAGYIIAAINLADVGLTPTYMGGGLIALHDTIHHKTDTLNSKLTQRGVPGGVVPVSFIPDASFDASQFAPLILDAIDNSLLTGVNLAFRGGTSYYINGIQSISGLQNFFISAIKDNAGNSLKPNQANNETHFTILMPGVQFDFGDAPEPYATLLKDNGARHAISGTPLMLGSGITAEDDALLPDGDLDDGVTWEFTTLNPFVPTPITVWSSGLGFLDAWVDFNHDGDWFDDGEQVFASHPLSVGANELTIQMPAQYATDARYETYARFRISSLGALGPLGLAIDGEVEDYRLEIVPGTPPVADDDEYDTTEDLVLDVPAPGVLEGDTDADGDPLSVAQYDALSALGALVTVDADGHFLYDPTTAIKLQMLPAGTVVDDTFTYRATDGGLTSNVATVTIHVAGVNDAPIANDDFYETTENLVLTVDAPGVLENDWDIDTGDVVSIFGFDATSALGAAVTLHSDGRLVYDPTVSTTLQALKAGESLEDTFSYTISDLVGALSTATVTVTVAGVNDPPVASNDTYATDEDSVLNVAAPGVLGNDSDPDGQALQVARYDTTSLYGATVTVYPDGSFTYDPTQAADLQALRPGQSVQDGFSYQATDGVTLSNIAFVLITVDGINDAPEAVDDAYSTDEDTELLVPAPGVLGNDMDKDAGDLLVVISADTQSLLGARVLVGGSGWFLYDPTTAPALQLLKPGQTLQDTFTYTVRDASGETSSATVTVTVSGRNDPPVAADDWYSVLEDDLLQVAAPGLLAGGSDADGDVLQVEAGTLASRYGAAVTLMEDGSFLYDPRSAAPLQALAAGQTLEDTFTYRVTDGTEYSAPATVTVVVTGVNDAPVAVDDFALVPPTGNVTVSVLANDSDIDGTLDPSTVTIITPPAHGTAAVLPDGTIKYTVGGNYSGLDTLTYTVRDNDGAESNVATVSLDFNAPPVAVDDTVEVLKNTPKTINVLANDWDSDGTLVPSSVTIVRGAAHGSLKVNTNGTVLYTPMNKYVGPDAFTYTVRDDDGATSNVATVTISVVENQRPWQNPVNFRDVNADGFISPIDALLIINDINYRGQRQLPNPPIPPLVPPPYLDVNGDGIVSPADALIVINYLNAIGGEGEAEGEGEAVAGAVPRADLVPQPDAALADEFQINPTVPADPVPSRLPSSMPAARPATVPVALALDPEYGLRIGQADVARQLALRDYLVSVDDEDVLELLAADAIHRWDAGDNDQAALLELLLGTRPR